jgi:CD2 antigen cytoplasmic tail-binding protein 2
MKKRKGLIRKRKDGAGREDSPDMGFQMERFNMKNEMATGRFDEQGNYVANARDPHAEHDSWLTGQYNRKTISAARTAQLRREKELRAQEAKRDTAKLDEDECKMRLAGLLRRSESVLEAIQRLGNEVKKMKKKRKEDTGEQSEASNAKSELDRLTSISSELMSRYGRANIYDVTYEELLRDVRRSGLVRETWDPAAANEKPSDQWLYRWSPAYLAATAGQDAEEKGEHFGPFTREDLHAWQDAGYFGEGGERIVLMPSGDEGQKKEWRSWAEAFLQ